MTLARPPAVQARPGPLYPTCNAFNRYGSISMRTQNGQHGGHNFRIDAPVYGSSKTRSLTRRRRGTSRPAMRRHCFLGFFAAEWHLKELYHTQCIAYNDTSGACLFLGARDLI